MPTRLVTALKHSFQLPESNLPLWDGWRGLAILCVLIGHFGNTGFIKEDRLGVDIFFVLSGMLMARILFEKRTPLSTFYVRRFSRIFPALLVFVATMFSGATLVGWQFSSLEVITNLTFLRTYIPADPHIWSGNVPVKNLWSLNVEEHAYVLMSVLTLILVSTVKVSRVLLGIAVASLAISVYYELTQDYEQTYFLLRTESAICFIMFSAGYRLFVRDYGVVVHPFLPVLALLLAMSCYLVALPFWMSFVFPPVLLAFAINHIAATPEWFRCVLASRPLRLLGLWSYSIYLWQQPLFEYKWALPGPDFALPLGMAVVVGILSHALIEAPARQFINQRWARRTRLKLQTAGAP
ncbi:MAG TPA: hypothetical protein DD979_03775 [Gammaproteobacteria bacterium]|nr:hypothetical protein [Gammaproteobacteria bacterium]